jgi:aldehyde:ferredoxin oxidoreductase
VSIESGYFKQYLRADLTSGACERVELSDEFLDGYVGGRGFGAKLVWDNLEAHGFSLDPLGPENLLVIAPGPLTGAYLPSSGKCSFIAISPATGIYGDSSIGGTFGVEIRHAGLDAVAVAGKAPELSILMIEEDQCRVIPMPELAGKTCLESEGIIKTRLGTHEVHIATIGVAGENLVRFACVNTDWSRNAGRTGVGAIMGSKNLKAIVVRGGRDLPVHDVPGLMKEAKKAYSYMKSHKFFRMWQQEGLMNVMQYANEMGILPAYNFRDTAFPKIDQVDGDTMLEHYKIGDSACFACSMSCGNICLVKKGKYTGTVVEGPEYETCAMLGPNVGVEDFGAVLKASQLCDELGIDTISTGNLIGALIEGYEKGIVSLEELDGRPIAWGDEDAIVEMVEKIARRQGVGDVLADGSRRVIEKWPEMDKVILQVKGLEQSAYDSRAGASMALAYATSDIGAHHTRAWTIAKEVELGQEWTDEDRVDIVIYHQTIRPLFDMLGVCRLPWIELGLNEKHYEEFYRCITGHGLTMDDLCARSRNVYDLTRRINAKLGMSRRNDTMPYKVHASAVRAGATAGKKIDREEFNRLLDLYYEKRGWNKDGIPPTP